MNDQEQSVESKSILLICDTNVLLKMALMKPSIMFDAEYFWGIVTVPDFIIDEIQRWIDKPGHPKVRKFGKEILEDIVKQCQGRSDHLQKVPVEAFNKKDAAIQAMANQLTQDQKGDDPSDEDRELLILASENNANLASDEKAHHSLSHCLNSDRSVCSFGMLVKDLLDRGMITKEEIRTGWHALEYHNERVRPDDRKILNQLIK